jgi:hypothetical protein
MFVREIHSSLFFLKKKKGLKDFTFSINAICNEVMFYFSPTLASAFVLGKFDQPSVIHLNLTGVGL